jgi:hypothetical protein
MKERKDARGSWVCTKIETQWAVMLWDVSVGEPVPLDPLIFPLMLTVRAPFRVFSLETASTVGQKLA